MTAISYYAATVNSYDTLLLHEKNLDCESPILDYNTFDNLVTYFDYLPMKMTLETESGTFPICPF